MINLYLHNPLIFEFYKNFLLMAGSVLILSMQIYLLEFRFRSRNPLSRLCEFLYERDLLKYVRHLGGHFGNLLQGSQQIQHR